MAQNFSFRLITPTGIVLESQVEEVVGFSALGEFGVLAEHIDFITSLVPGLLRVRISADRQADYIVTGGLAAVKEGAMTVMADEVESLERLNRAAVTDEMTATEQRLGQTSYYSAEYAEAERALLLARARTRAIELESASR
jgi:F-type H+-transporting ATPase subunit epsilon